LFEETFLAHDTLAVQADIGWEIIRERCAADFTVFFHRMFHYP